MRLISCDIVTKREISFFLKAAGETRIKEDVLLLCDDDMSAIKTVDIIPSVEKRTGK